MVEGRRAATLPSRTLGSLRFRKPGWGRAGETRRVDQSDNSFLILKFTGMSLEMAPFSLDCFTAFGTVALGGGPRHHLPPPGSDGATCLSAHGCCLSPALEPRTVLLNPMQGQTPRPREATATQKGSPATEEVKKHSNRGRFQWPHNYSGVVWGLGGFGGCFLIGFFFFNRFPIPKNNSDLPETLTGDELL